MYVFDSAEGVSAYSGGLWVACLKAASKIAESLEIPEDASSYEALYQKAATRYNQALWNSKVQYECYLPNNESYLSLVFLFARAATTIMTRHVTPIVTASWRTRCVLSFSFACNIILYLLTNCGVLFCSWQASGMRVLAV